MNREKEKGAILIEAAVVIPLYMVLMMVLFYLINIFVVQTYVQYGLNMTVNEVGNYTYYVDAIGGVKKLRAAKKANTKVIDDFKDDVSDVTKAFSSTKALFDSASDTVQSANDTLNAASGDIDFHKLFDLAKGTYSSAQGTISQAQNTKNDVSAAWSTVQVYLKDPSKLLAPLMAFLKQEAITTGSNILGTVLGKAMMYSYCDNDMLKGLGVVSTDYNGRAKNYNKGIDGIDFTNSTIFGDEDCRTIDIVAVYRIKYPVNVSYLAADESSALYSNSLLITQRAVGYGWVDGDKTASSKNASGLNGGPNGSVYANK